MGGAVTGHNNATRGRLTAGLAIAILILALFGCKPAAEGSVPPPNPYQPGATATLPPTATLSGPPPATPPVQEPTAAPATPTLAATVNGEPLTLLDYQKQVTEWEIAFITQNESLDEEEKREMLLQGRRQVLDVMIEQMLIEQAAAAEGVRLSEAEVKSVIDRDIAENGGKEQFEAWLADNQWTYEEYQKRQQAMMLASMMFERVTESVPTTAEQVHARHILVATEEEARALLAQIEQGADFGDLAREHSLDPSNKDSGGDLGFFPRGTLVVPEIEDVAFALSVGQTSEVVKSPMGHHLVQVVEREQDRELTEESWQALKEATFRRWVSELWDAAEIVMHIAL